jgi:hypothetical protein
MKIFANKFQPIQYINKKPYLIHAVIEIGKVEGLVTEMKQYLGCDTAFKVLKENVYYFAEEIKEVKFEEI